jgi:hypothetical protein
MDLKIEETLKRLLVDKEVKKVAKACDVKYTTLHSWMLGHTSPGSKQMPALVRLADYFEITLEELLLNTKLDRPNNEIIMSTTFRDEENTYRVVVEKLKNS